MMIESETGAPADVVSTKDINGGDREDTGLSRSKSDIRCCKSIMEWTKAWRGPRYTVDAAAEPPKKKRMKALKFFDGVADTGA